MSADAPAANAPVATAPIPTYADPAFSPRVLNAGFIIALLIGVFMMLASVAYLAVFMLRISEPPTLPELPPPPATGQDFAKDAYYVTRYDAQVRMHQEARSEASNLVFNSCVLLFGIAVAFIGLALFMMGIRGEMDAAGRGQGVTIRLTRLSPGMLALLCATVVVIWCLTSRPARATVAPPPSGPSVSGGYGTGTGVVPTSYHPVGYSPPALSTMAANQLSNLAALIHAQEQEPELRKLLEELRRIEKELKDARDKLKKEPNARKPDAGT